jgi:hypothetical protein
LGAGNCQTAGGEQSGEDAEGEGEQGFQHETGLLSIGIVHPE